MVAFGCAETGDGEWSFYVTEHYRYPDNRIRRYTVRKHGFASAHAGYREGELVTRPLIVTGKKILLNYSTSAVGSVSVEVLDEAGNVLQGLGLKDMDPLYGDELAGEIEWKSGKDLGEYNGIPVRFRFRLKDADIFAFKVV
jgi:hypothetical protein